MEFLIALVLGVAAGSVAGYYVAKKNYNKVAATVIKAVENANKT